MNDYLSRINESFNLTLYNARGSELNLTIMFYLALFIVPIVILYQTWLYRVFREKITTDNARGITNRVKPTKKASESWLFLSYKRA
ncbi:cytochrome d ubiquinol oxidase subunit II [Brevibacillus ginsengisoli]|uniref:cytochrome d ubiquinol oxidase subunit II n=1 Tax=Brevibacillus ginsengisoli TaxID=363854 RepID=UPI003CF4BE1D